MKLQIEQLESRDCPSAPAISLSAGELSIVGTDYGNEKVIITQPTATTVKVVASNDSASITRIFARSAVDHITATVGSADGADWEELTGTVPLRLEAGSYYSHVNNDVLRSTAPNGWMNVYADFTLVHNAAHTQSVYVAGDSDTIISDGHSTIINYGDGLTYQGKGYDYLDLYGNYLTVTGGGHDSGYITCHFSTINSGGNSSLTIGGYYEYFVANENTINGGVGDTLRVTGDWYFGYLPSYDTINLATNSTLETYGGSAVVLSKGHNSIETNDGNNAIYGGPSDTWTNDGNPSDTFLPYGTY